MWTPFATFGLVVRPAARDTGSAAASSVILSEYDTQDWQEALLKLRRGGYRAAARHDGVADAVAHVPVQGNRRSLDASRRPTRSLHAPATSRGCPTRRTLDAQRPLITAKTLETPAQTHYLRTHLSKPITSDPREQAFPISGPGIRCMCTAPQSSTSADLAISRIAL